jgi:hypothetical protein
MSDPSTNPYAPPLSSEPGPAPVEPRNGDGPRGIGGWLLLSFLGVLGVIGLSLYGLVNNLVHWDSYTFIIAVMDPGAYWIWLVHIAGVATMFTMGIVAVVWMLQHDRRVPRWMVAFYVVQALVLLFAVSFVGDARPTSTDSARGFGQLIPFIRCLLWVFYFMHSERVANTFVK